MANLGFVFDASQVEPDAPLEAIPSGKYLAMMIESEYTQNRAKTGTLVKFKLEVVDGPYKGRRVFGNINMTNPNPEAERIGRAQFSALCRATGVMQVQETSALHNRPICVSVEYTEPRTEGQKTYPAGNDIKGYLPPSEYQAQAARPAAAHAPAPAPAYAAPPAAAPVPAAAPQAPVYAAQPAPAPMPAQAPVYDTAAYAAQAPAAAPAPAYAAAAPVPPAAAPAPAAPWAAAPAH